MLKNRQVCYLIIFYKNWYVKKWLISSSKNLHKFWTYYVNPTTKRSPIKSALTDYNVFIFSIYEVLLDADLE